MSGTSPRVYLDTSSIVSWLKDGAGESLDPDVLPAMAEMFRAMVRSELIIVTSAVTLCEVLDCVLDEGVKQKIGNWPRRNFQVLPFDKSIAMMTHSIRNHYRDWRTLGVQKLKTPDAIHLATCIYAEANVLYSTDPDLKSYNGRIMDKYDLKIGDPGSFNVVTPLFEKKEERNG